MSIRGRTRHWKRWPHSSRSSSRRNSDRGQCFGNQRWRLRLAAGFRSGGEEIWVDAESASGHSRCPPELRRESWAWAPCRHRAKCCRVAGLSIDDMDVIELNEAFAAQGLAVLRELGVPDDSPRSIPTAARLPLDIRWVPAEDDW